MEGALKESPGVRRVGVSHESATAIVEFDPGVTTERDLHASIRTAGYGVAGEDQFQTIRKRGAGVWVQAYVDRVDADLCTGCGRCIGVCGQSVYALRDTGGVKRAVVVNGDECLGDCHCHRVCDANAIVCRPRRLERPNPVQEKLT